MRRSQRESCDNASISCSKIYKNKTQLSAETCTRTSIIAQFRFLYFSYVVDNRMPLIKKFINHFLKQKKSVHSRATEIQPHQPSHVSQCKTLIQSLSLFIALKSVSFISGQCGVLNIAWNFQFRIPCRFCVAGSAIADRRSSLQERKIREGKEANRRQVHPNVMMCLFLDSREFPLSSSFVRC